MVWEIRYQYYFRKYDQSHRYIIGSQGPLLDTRLLFPRWLGQRGLFPHGLHVFPFARWLEQRNRVRTGLNVPALYAAEVNGDEIVQVTVATARATAVDLLTRVLTGLGLVWENIMDPLKNKDHFMFESSKLNIKKNWKFIADFSWLCKNLYVYERKSLRNSC